MRSAWCRLRDVLCMHVRQLGAGIMQANDRQVTTVFTVQPVIPPSALDKPSIMKRYYRRRTTRWGVTARSPTMVTLHDTRFVECRWWNDGWTVKTVVTWRSSASMIPAPGHKPSVVFTLPCFDFPSSLFLLSTHSPVSFSELETVVRSLRSPT